MNSNMIKPGKYDHNIHLFYNITTYNYFQITYISKNTKHKNSKPHPFESLLRLTQCFFKKK